jgi:hypothetical protein
MTGPRGALIGLILGAVIVVLPVSLAVLMTGSPKEAPTAPQEIAAPVEPVETQEDPKPLPILPAINPFRDDALPELKDLLAADAANPGAIEYKLVQRPNEGVAQATEDILNVGRYGQTEQPFMRYLWFPTPTDLTEAELAFTLNTAVSHAKFPYKPVKISDNLYRVDLRALAPEKADFERLVQIWENELPRHNFWFNTIRDGKFVINEKKKVKRTKTIQEDQKTPVRDRWGNQQFDNRGQPAFTIKKVSKTIEFEEEVEEPTEVEREVVEFAIHTGLDKMLLLASLTQSSVPIYHGPDFIVKALSTRNNGLYNKFVNMPRGKAGQTDMQAFIELFGGETDPAKRKENASYVAIPISGVTFKPRQIEYFYGNKARPAVGPPLVTITHDLRDEDIHDGKLTRKTIARNLLNFKGKAFEAIGQRENGMFLYALFNDKEELIDTAPDTVAKDNVHPGILETPISCIRCHGPNDGRQPAINGIKSITRGGLDVFDDESSNKDPRETIDLLVSMYKGDLTKPLMDTRNAYSQTVFILTGGKSVPAVSASVGGMVLDHLHAPITPKKAVLDLGYYVETEEDAVRLLARILPPLEPNRYGISSEDPLIADLRAWNPREPILALPQEWKEVLSDALLRVITEEAKVRIAHPELKMHGPVNIQPVNPDLHKVKDAK